MTRRECPPAGETRGPENNAAGGLSTATLQRPAANRARLRRLVHQIDLDQHLRQRGVQQAILQAEAWWWRWRAEDFHRARPRPGDFNGRASRAELAEADRRCSETARACLNRAALIEWEAADVD